MKTEIQFLHRRALLFGPLSALVIARLRAAGEPTRIGAAAPPFHLKDQFDHDINLADLNGSLVVIVCGDRRGGDYMSGWVKAVGNQYSPPVVTILRVANLAGIPPFFHSYVKQRFLEKDSEGQSTPPTLLDWDGLIPQLYGFTGDLTNTYVIDRHGVFRYKTSGKGTSDEIRRLLGTLEEILRETATSSLAERKQP